MNADERILILDEILVPPEIEPCVETGCPFALRTHYHPPSPELIRQVLQALSVEVPGPISRSVHTIVRFEDSWGVFWDEGTKP